MERCEETAPAQMAASEAWCETGLALLGSGGDQTEDLPIAEGPTTPLLQPSLTIQEDALCNGMLHLFQSMLRASLMGTETEPLRSSPTT